MQCSPDGPTRINSFALVAYIPNPLGEFLDRLREELVPGCRPHAHVTVLPPRPLKSSVDDAWKQACTEVRGFPPFEIGAGRVEIFSVTDVIYISIETGRPILEAMHSALNIDSLAYEEPFNYHPHITLAQSLPPQEVWRIYELAKQRWEEFHDQRNFTVDSLTFVQNTLENTWLDLVECPLAGVAAVSTK